MFGALKDARIYKGVIRNLDPEEVISYEDYCHFIDLLISKEYTWPYAKRIEIRKIFSQKRRIVYHYPKMEMFFLRAVNHYLFKKFSRLVSPSYFPSLGRSPSQCLSFLLGKLARYASARNMHKEALFGLHLDISDYFNSMDADTLFNRLPEEIQKDDDFRRLYEQTIKSLYAFEGEKLVECPQKGAMAGLPLTAFFAAIYLSGLDNYFSEKGIPYARYSDDILFFSENEYVLQESYDYTVDFIQNAKLSINPLKTEKVMPHTPWTFIGFEVYKDTIDIAAHSEEKIKRRVGRWARRLRKRVEIGYGNPIRKAKPEKAAASLIKAVNRALFKPIKDKYCWARWAFPTINTTKRLEALDVFIQEKIRYVYTGRYSRANYQKLPYDKMAGLGYMPLVKLYHLYRYRPDDYKSFLDNYIMVPARGNQCTQSSSQ